MSKLILLHESDQVAVLREAVVEGEAVFVSGYSITAMQNIPAMHKIAVTAVPKGGQILKYGQFIGKASEDIAPGEHVHVHNCEMSDFNKDYGFCRNAKPTGFVSESERATFEGYQRESGKVGTRNYIGILTTVNCSGTPAKHIASLFSTPGALDEFPDVDGVIALTHDSGCGMRSEGEGYEILRRTFEGYVRHPNFGGVLLIGLGCETMQVKKILQESGLAESDTFQSYTIQEVGGTRAAVEKGVEFVRALLPKVNAVRRETCPASELTLAVQCGGSDAMSGITANPALGVASDLLVRHGGTVIYSETPEIYGAEHLLTQRAETPEIAQKLLARIRWWENYTRQHGFELNNNPSPGNKEGGLTTILEKSLGAQTKSGSCAMVDVYEYAEIVKRQGLVFMDSPGFDPVSVTGQVASGANVICFTTGRGSTFGFKPVPSIKLASNSETWKQMEEDIDINCGTILDGGRSVYGAGEDIFKAVFAIASGERSKSELMGFGEVEFNPWKVGAVV